MSIQLPELNYPQDGLVPVLSEDVIKYHYSHHTKKYFDTVNELIKGTTFDKYDNLNDLITKETLMKMDSTLFNNAAQAYNHAFYWDCLCPVDKVGKPSDELIVAINREFTSLDEFKKKFNEKATKLFGSGWCWIIFHNDKIQIKTTPNAGTPLTDKGSVPLLVCDLWEHGYYLQYPADRAGYVKEFWKIVNWNFVNKNFENKEHK